MKLRGYQESSVRKLWKAYRAGKRRVLFYLPTGGGKTVTAVHMMQTWVNQGAKILFISGRREHINQAYKTLIDYGIDKEKLSVILRKDDPREDEKAPIQIASKDTLVRRKLKPSATVVIIDEAHHAAAGGYQKLLACYPAAVHLGLTATPYRMTGKGLVDVFDELVIGAKPSELIAEHALAEPRVFTVPDRERRRLNKTLKEVKSIGGDYSRDGLDRVAKKHKRLLVGDLLRYWRKYGKDKPTVIYAVNRRHARHIVNMFADAGVAAELLTGLTSVEDRGAMIGGESGWAHSRLAMGKTQVVVNCAVLVEGWDCPPAKCIMIARPTKSLAFWIHACGRALRPGRVRPIILDHAGNALRAGIRCLPHEDLELTLEQGSNAKERRSQAGPKACPECNAISKRGAEACEACGHVFAKEPELKDGKLKELTPEDMAAARAKEERRLLRLVERGQIPVSARAAIKPHLDARFS